MLYQCGTSRIGDQRNLRQAYAFAQSRQSLHFSHDQRMKEGE